MLKDAAVDKDTENEGIGFMLKTSNDQWADTKVNPGNCVWYKQTDAYERLSPSN